MKRLFAGITTVIAATLTLVSCQEPSLSQEDVLMAMDSLETKLEWLEYRLPLEQWSLESTGRTDSLELYTELFQEVLSRNSLRDLLTKGENLLTDEVDRRRHNLLLRTLLWHQVEGSPAVRALRDSIIGPGRDRSRRPVGTMRAAYLFDGLWSANASQTLREQSFVAHFASLENLAAGVGQMIRGRNQAARRLGYSNFLSVAFGADNIKAEDMLQFVARLETATDAAYASLLDELERRESVGTLELWDVSVSYTSLLTQISGRLNSETTLPIVAATLDAAGFGLDTLPLYYDLQPAKGDRSGAQSFLISPGREARILLRDGGGLPAIQNALAVTAGALSFLGRDETNIPLFARYTDHAWEEGMAALFGTLVGDSTWLVAEGELPAQDAARLHRLAAEQNLLALRLALTDFMFEYEAYKNPQRDLDRLYWDLFERYVKLPRHDGLFVWAGRPELITSPFDIRDALLGQIIRSQTLEYFSSRYGTIVNNSELRSFLGQSYFRFGGRYPWPQLLEHGTGQPLKADFLANAIVTAL
ncbi:MAG: hypothetical protein ABIE70_07210 [bacterium]